MVGFDLDMTLVDSRPGIKAVYDIVAAESGVEIDSDLVVSRLGPPLEQEMANWFPADRVPAMADLYRRYYAEHAVAAATAMPGATEAIDSVRALGGLAVVVTAKHEAHARAHLAVLGMEAEAVHGGVWRDGKAEALRVERAVAYVGDHVDDVQAARSAGAVAVAVTTGPCHGMELADAGADVVLHTLLDFDATALASGNGLR